MEAGGNRTGPPRSSEKRVDFIGPWDGDAYWDLPSRTTRASPRDEAHGPIQPWRDGRFDSFPSPPKLRFLLSSDAGHYSQLLNWQISERWLLGKRCSEDVPTSGGENTLRPACVEHAQPESRSRRTAFPNSWARSSALRPCFSPVRWSATARTSRRTRRAPCPWRLPREADRQAPGLVFDGSSLSGAFSISGGSRSPFNGDLPVEPRVGAAESRSAHPGRSIRAAWRGSRAPRRFPHAERDALPKAGHPMSVRRELDRIPELVGEIERLRAPAVGAADDSR